VALSGMTKVSRKKAIERLDDMVLSSLLGALNDSTATSGMNLCLFTHGGETVHQAACLLLELTSTRVV
jgi:hypothetical protein